MNTSEIPSFLTQTGPAAYTLTLSASAAETFMLCPAKYAWSRVTGIEAASPRAGMNYGKALHLALAHLYLAKHGDAERINGDAEAQVRDWFARNPQPLEGAKGKVEWRTLARALQAFAAYREAYPAEAWEVLGVEEAFEVTLGTFGNYLNKSFCDEILVTVKFRGIRDLRVRWHDSIWVVDHKTMQEYGDLVADEGKASFQFMGYAWVERALAAMNFCKGCGNEIDPEVCHCGEEVKRHGMGSGHSPVPMGCTCGYADQSQFPKGPFTAPAVGGVIGNYIVARPPYAEGRKPTPRDLPRDQFERVPYPFSDAQLDEWHARAMGLARGIWEAWSAQEWRQHSTGCAHWGRCEYYALCWETDPAYRESAALGADYRKRTPSPLDEVEAL